MGRIVAMQKDSLVTPYLGQSLNLLDVILDDCIRKMGSQHLHTGRQAL
jgi:hypothetical protein